MKLAILSDIHDALDSLSLALERASSCDVLLCCGDLCSPFVIHHLGKGFKGTIHIVFGNNDGDLYRMTQNSQAYSTSHCTEKWPTSWWTACESA